MTLWNKLFNTTEISVFDWLRHTTSTKHLPNVDPSFMLRVPSRLSSIMATEQQKRNIVIIGNFKIPPFS
jgi:hypothetical protein